MIMMEQTITEIETTLFQAVYKTLSRGCYRNDELVVKNCLDMYYDAYLSLPDDKKIDLSAKVFGEMYYISDANYKKGHSLLVLALKFSNTKITRMLIEQGVDMESENLYAIALRGIWKSDWFEKTDMMLDIADIAIEDKSNLLLDHALFFLSTDRLLPLLHYLIDSNWNCFEKMFKSHFHHVWKTIEAMNHQDGGKDDDRKKLQDFLLDYVWVLDL
jgi:hypothetical protein